MRGQAEGCGLGAVRRDWVGDAALGAHLEAARLEGEARIASPPGL